MKKSEITGLAKLEMAIMEELWRLKAASVRQVLFIIRKKKKIAYTTVMTVMSRLFEKGILKRRLDENNAYIYTPIQNKEAFSASISKNVINNLINDYGGVAIAQLIDVIDKKNKKELAGLLNKLKEVK